jgi:hypothetical protein
VEFQYAAHGSRKVGHCNICQEYGRLTWDHVPPQGSTTVSEVEVDRLFFTFKEIAKNRPKFSQNGLKYRTICASCNSRLGTDFDPVLKDFAGYIAQVLNSRLILPSLLYIPTRPTALARAILGHLLAARLYPEDQGFDGIVRTFLFDDSAPIPEELSVFCWVHPFDHHVILRSVMMPARRGNFSSFGMFSIVKFFPVGFLVTDQNSYEGLEALTAWRSLPCSETAKVVLNTRDIRGPFWPEQRDPGNAILMGSDGIDSVVAVPRKRKDRET